MMLKHVPQLYSVKMKKNLAAMNEFLASPPPRKVDRELLRACIPPGIWSAGIVLAGGLIASCAFLGLALKGPAGIHLSVWAGTGFFFLFFSGLFLYFRELRNKSGKRCALARGELFEAAIDDISSANTYKNYSYYYRMKYSFSDSSGKIVRGVEYVPPRFITFYEQLQGEGETKHLDILHVPDSPRATFIPLIYVLTANKA